MKRAAAVALAVLLLLLPTARGDPADPRDPGNVNRVLRVVESPQLAPGDAGVFRFNLTNAYSFEMENVSLNVSIYAYATIEEYIPVTASWPWAYPLIQESGRREYRILGGNLTDRILPNEVIGLSFTVLTSWDMPHGSVFAQSAYFLRFWLEFDFDNGTLDRYVMASKGYFSLQRWEEARTNFVYPQECNEYNATNRCVGDLNLTHLGVDGIIPDSSIGVKEPIPVWPFYALVVMTGFFLVLAFLFWVEENPSQYPRVERAWLTFKGRLRRTFRLPRPRRL